MHEERVIWEAEFNDAVTSYWLLTGALICVFTIIGIPFLPIWLLCGKWLTRKYLASHVCTLTDRSLKVAKGILTKIEKTVPLDRITDVGIVEGPVMRYFKIESLSVETAGQSSEGAIIRLAGIKDGRKFRDAVLKQRETLVGTKESVSTSMPQRVSDDSSEAVTELLSEIRDSLQRIETQIKPSEGDCS